MFVNDDILSLGSENTETITIENNKITVGYPNILLYNEEETLCHSDIEAIIKLKNGIGGEDSVIFKNEDVRNCSFKVESGSKDIEANEININSDVIILDVTNDEKLTIEINEKNVKNINM